MNTVFESAVAAVGRAPGCQVQMTPPPGPTVTVNRAGEPRA